MQTLQLQRSTRRAFVIQACLNAKSEIFSVLMEEPVSRIQVIRVHLIFLFILLTAVAADTAPVVSLLSAAASGYLIYSLNKNEKGGAK